MPYWRLFYHLVWATKGRQPAIQPAFEKRLHAAIRAKADELGAFVHAVGGTDDHIHLVASVPPAISLAQFAGQIKGATSHLVNHVLCPSCAFGWQPEYGCVSFGGRQLDRVVKYVINQRQHHGAGTVVPLLERDGESQEGSPGNGSPRPKPSG